LRFQPLERFMAGTPIALPRKSNGGSQGVFTNGEENGRHTLPQEVKLII
jgi:hypothetical protein